MEAQQHSVAVTSKFDGTIRYVIANSKAGKEVLREQQLVDGVWVNTGGTSDAIKAVMIEMIKLKCN